MLDIWQITLLIEYVFIHGYEQYINRFRFINKNALFNSADMALIETEDGKN
jgi:hypothetical protein